MSNLTFSNAVLGLCLWSASSILSSSKRAFLIFFLFSDFKAITKMVLDKVRSIPRHQRILFYHHSLQHVLRYLLLQPL